MAAIQDLLEEIHNLHSQWSVMEKSSKSGWLIGKTMQLNGLANQLAQHVWAAGGFVNEAERAYARELLEMIQAVEAESVKMKNEIRNEAVKELAKLLIRG